ncbi:uncharacterized protein METZ01_LOCUS151419, partial [marine metagenome]
MKHTLPVALLLLLLVALAEAVTAQTTEAQRAAVATSIDYRIVPNIVYQEANGFEAKLDLYLPSDRAPAPTLINFHGGGWRSGTKE